MPIIEKYQDGVLYYQFKRINDLKFIKHLFTSKIGWEYGNILDKISDIFKAPRANIITVKQVHGTDIMVIDSKIQNYKNLSSIEADGLVTNIPNIILTTYHADCVPVYFLDQAKKVIGIAHSGWRGTYANITGNMIELMEENYNSNKEDIVIGIGPSIGSCCYEVGKDLADKFTERYPKFDNILVKKSGRVYLDLWKINYNQIREKGIPVDNIILSNICTSCKIDRFHSYRRERGTKNRMVAAIGLID